MKKTWMSTLLVTAVLLAGCGEKEYQATDINPQTDICEICNMSVAAEQYAGQIALENGDYEMFDDLGCLMEYYNEMNLDDLGKAFIKDTDSEDWLDVEKSVFVFDEELPTPMSHGVIAFKDEAAASSFVDKEGSGKVITFEELKSMDWGA